MTTNAHKPSPAQRITDARAALLELGSRRIEIESRAAQAELSRLANKADQKAYRAAIVRLRDVGEELDRVGLLIAEAKGELECATADELAESMRAEVAQYEAGVSIANELASEFAAATGLWVAAARKLRSAVEAADQAASGLRTRGANVADGGLIYSRELLAIGPRGGFATALGGLRHAPHVASVVATVLKAADLRAPRPGANYAVSQIVPDFIDGTYVGKRDRIEAA